MATHKEYLHVSQLKENLMKQKTSYSHAATKSYMLLLISTSHFNDPEIVCAFAQYRLLMFLLSRLAKVVTHLDLYPGCISFICQLKLQTD
jgi:hypothetical protein